MPSCSNCGTALSCGCQKRVANDGTSCCTSCVANYNNTHPAPVKIVKLASSQQAGTAPSNVNVHYFGPGRQIS